MFVAVILLLIGGVTFFYLGIRIVVVGVEPFLGPFLPRLVRGNSESVELALSRMRASDFVGRPPAAQRPAHSTNWQSDSRFGASRAHSKPPKQLTAVEVAAIRG